MILDARVKLKHGEYIEHQDQIRIDTNKISDTHESIWFYPNPMMKRYKKKKTKGNELGRTKALILCVDKYYN